jgi:hypothetical protein
MKLERYKTNVWLWLCLALVLFVALGFVPFSDKGSRIYPVWIWPAFFIGLFRSDVPLSEVGQMLRGLGWYTLFYGVPSLLIAWVLQCVIQIARRRGRPDVRSSSP